MRPASLASSTPLIASPMPPGQAANTASLRDAIGIDEFDAVRARLE
jgi:hypothetical protein